MTGIYRAAVLLSAATASEPVPQPGDHGTVARLLVMASRCTEVKQIWPRAVSAQGA